MVKIRVTIDVEVESNVEDVQEIKRKIINQLGSYEGWQIFGEDEPLDESIITNVTAEVV